MDEYKRFAIHNEKIISENGTRGDTMQEDRSLPASFFLLFFLGEPALAQVKATSLTFFSHNTDLPHRRRKTSRLKANRIVDR